MPICGAAGRHGRTVAPPGPSEAGRMPGHRRGGGGAAGRQGPAWAPVYCQSRADASAPGRAERLQTNHTPKETNHKPTETSLTEVSKLPGIC